MDWFRVDGEMLGVLERTGEFAVEDERVAGVDCRVLRPRHGSRYRHGYFCSATPPRVAPTDLPPSQEVKARREHARLMAEQILAERRPTRPAAEPELPTLRGRWRPSTPEDQAADGWLRRRERSHRVIARWQQGSLCRGGGSSPADLPSEVPGLEVDADPFSDWQFEGLFDWQKCRPKTRPRRKEPHA